MAEVVRHPYRPRGAALDLFRCRDAEVLIAGPAGTGKSRALLELANYYATMFPGCRGMFLRLTKASLAESVLPTWETKVLWEGHPAINGKASMEQRRSYTYPKASNTVRGKTYSGRSHIVLMGLDKPSKTFSQEYDWIMLFEAIEVVDPGHWELLLRALRNWHMPFQQAFADTNPGPATHWLKQRSEIPLEYAPEVAAVIGAPRAGQQQMTRIDSVHEDNPELWDAKARRWTLKGAAYIAKLDGMSGARKERMRYGRWVSETGLIWELDQARHFTERTREPGALPERVPHPRDKQGDLALDWYFASVDWGMTDPFVLQVWGVHDARGALYRVAEIYRTEQTLSWICDRIREINRRWELRRVTADPSRKDLIDLFNRVLAEDRPEQPEVQTLVQKARNDWEAGVQAVRLLLEDAPDGYARMFFCRDPLLWGRDERLADDLKPICTEQEIDGYVWRKNEAGKVSKKEGPAPGLADHGCDPTRYAAMLHLYSDSQVADELAEIDEEVEEGSMAQVLRHAEKWERIRYGLDYED